MGKWGERIGHLVGEMHRGKERRSFQNDFEEHTTITTRFGTRAEAI
jgi:hypothetical protein